MKADGNCFYRSISYELFGTQDEDYAIHSVLITTENLNKSIFSSFLIPGVYKNTIEEHICHVSAEVTWGKRVEVIATATAFEVPVYFCKPSSSSSDGCAKYIWNVIYQTIEV